MQLRIAQQRVQAHLRIELAVKPPTMSRKGIDELRRGAKNVETPIIEFLPHAQELRDPVFRGPDPGIHPQQERKSREPHQGESPAWRRRKF